MSTNDHPAELPRLAGVLTPVSAIRAPHCLGIGDTGALKRFIDWAAECGFRIVKLLPINETGGDHSPYNAISSRALEPSLLQVDPVVLEDLPAAKFAELTGVLPDDFADGELIEYAMVKRLKQDLLFHAFEHFVPTSCQLSPRQTEFEDFEAGEAAWLPSYTLFRALMEENGSEVWTAWPEEQRSLEAALKWLEAQPPMERTAIERRRTFHAYVQWQAALQWLDVKQHAVGRSVELMGDIPFGVNFYSADVWAQPQLFKAGWSGGTPPDKLFTHDPFVQKWGQNWGIPLYDWEAMRADGFAWWKQRVAGTRAFFHLFRIDHVLGFYRIYAFPWRPEENDSFLELSPEEAQERCQGREAGFQPRPDDTDENKAQNRADGEAYLRVVLHEAGEGRVVGEDLGEVPDYVRPSLTELGIGGYKVPQWEKTPEGKLIPHSEYQRLSLATYATHDHEPLRVLWEHLAAEAGTSELAKSEIGHLLEFASFRQPPPEVLTDLLHEALLRALFASNSWLAVVMITDVFGGSERFNQPGVAGSQNWTRRLHGGIEELTTSPKAATIRRLLEEAGRCGGAVRRGDGNMKRESREPIPGEPDWTSPGG